MELYLIYLHDLIQPDDIIEISAPAGDFFVTLSEKPMVLLSGGIGITPLLSMLYTTIEKEPNRKVFFVHATENGDAHAFKEDVANLAVNNNQVDSFVCYETPTKEDKREKKFDKEGFVDLNWLKSILPSNDAIFYLCGPVPFLEAMVRILHQWNVPEDQIHFEVFNPIAILGGK